MSIWLFIYLFKYRGRERTNTRRTTGEKREFFFLYLKKTKRWAQHLDTRVQESAEEPFFFLFLFSYFFFSIFLLVSPPPGELFGLVSLN
jgi:hypothetical protein